MSCPGIFHKISFICILYICLKQILHSCLNWGNKISEIEYHGNIWTIYCEPIISLCLYVTCIIPLLYVPYRHSLKTSFKYTLNILDVLMKHEIGTSSHCRYMNMSSQIFAKIMKNYYNCMKHIVFHAYMSLICNRCFISLIDVSFRHFL